MSDIYAETAWRDLDYREAKKGRFVRVAFSDGQFAFGKSWPSGRNVRIDLSRLNDPRLFERVSS